MNKDYKSKFLKKLIKYVSKKKLRCFYLGNFFNINDKETLVRNVAKRRRDTGGNYDGMLGVVSHFDWTANSDGSYDCQIKIMGPGSVVESLTINYGAKLKVNNNSSLPRLNIYQAVLAAQAQGAAPPAPPPTIKILCN